MPFQTSFNAVHVPGSQNWILLDDLVWTSKDEKTYAAPKGMATDLYSIPGPLRGLLFRAAKYVEAAVLHDAAYRGLLVGGAGLIRKEADVILLDAMSDMGAPWSLRWTIYWGVRAGGGRSFQPTTA